MIARFLVSLLLLLGVMVPATVYAADPYGGLSTACAQAPDSTVCKTKGNTTDPVTGPNGVLDKAITIVAFIAGIAAVLFMIVAGIRYITAQGDPQEISKAKQSIIYASVGLIAIVLARELINFVLSKI